MKSDRLLPFAKILLPGPLLSLALLAAFVTDSSSRSRSAAAGSPANAGVPAPRRGGIASAGRQVFRFETFGNEGFWTDAARMHAGVMAARVTPLKALRLGLSVDVDALAPAMRQALAAQLRADPSGRTSALLNDPQTAAMLIDANAPRRFHRPPRGRPHQSQSECRRLARHGRQLSGSVPRAAARLESQSRQDPRPGAEGANARLHGSGGGCLSVEPEVLSDGHVRR